MLIASLCRLRPSARSVPSQLHARARCVTLYSLRLFLTRSLGILQALALRFADKKIYTYAGSIVIALNPYHMMHELYSKETMACTFLRAFCCCELDVLLRHLGSHNLPRSVRRSTHWPAASARLCHRRGRVSRPPAHSTQPIDLGVRRVGRREDRDHQVATAGAQCDLMSVVEVEIHSPPFLILRF